MTDDSEYSAFDLRDMDEETAWEELSRDQYEQWEKIQELYDGVDEAEQAFEEQAETVAEVTVAADMEALGTRVDIYGNDLLVHADPEDPDLRDTIQRLDDEFGDLDISDDAAEARLDAYADTLLTLLDTVLVEWDGTRWEALDEGQRQTILADARAKWGLGGLVAAWGDIAAAIQEDREEVVDRLEKFRNPERRGNR